MEENQLGNSLVGNIEIFIEFCRKECNEKGKQYAQVSMQKISQENNEVVCAKKQLETTQVKFKEGSKEIFKKSLGKKQQLFLQGSMQKVATNIGKNVCNKRSKELCKKECRKNEKLGKKVCKVSSKELVGMYSRKVAGN